MAAIESERSLQHLILGNGPAGVLATETIRRHRRLDRIVLVGDEAEPPYSRMAIPYLLTGSIGETGTYLRHDPEHFRVGFVFVSPVSQTRSPRSENRCAGKRLGISNPERTL